MSTFEILLLVLLPAVPALITYFQYCRWKVYRPIKPIESPIPVDWNLPKYLQPAEVSLLFDRTMNHKSIAALLIDLAGRGYIRIKELSPSEKKSRLKRINEVDPILTDYEFISLKDDYSELEEYEIRLLENLSLLSDCTDEEIGQPDWLASLWKPKYEMLIEKMSNANFLSSVPAGELGWSLLSVILLLLWPLIALEILSHILMASDSFIVVFQMLFVWSFICICLMMYFIFLMPARTALGSKRLSECLSYLRFIKAVTSERLNILLNNKSSEFAEMYAFSIAVRHETIWKSKVGNLEVPCPSWFEPTGLDSSGSIRASTLITKLEDFIDCLGFSFGLPKTERLSGAQSNAFNEMTADLDALLEPISETEPPEKRRKIVLGRILRVARVTPLWREICQSHMLDENIPVEEVEALLATFKKG